MQYWPTVCNMETIHVASTFDTPTQSNKRILFVWVFTKSINERKSRKCELPTRIFYLNLTCQEVWL